MNRYSPGAARASLRATLITLIALPVTARAAASAQTIATHADSATAAGSDAWSAAVLGTQINVIAQDLRPLRSPYAGTNSLRARGDSKISHAYGVYAGAQAWSRVQAYLDVEMIRGKGISSVTGLAGPTNGDVLRQGTVDLGNGPYVARAFVRFTQPRASTRRDTLTRAEDQLPAVVSGERLEVTAGKFAASDLFDVNRYANSTRQQFMNWDLFQNTAWDFAADTRGYTNGVAIAWIHPRWTLSAGSFQMPTFANGNVFDSDLRRARGDQAELTVTVPRTQTVARFLGYVNHARMGSYADALATARATNTTPDVVANDRPGRMKHGYGINVEQPIADDGETGAFARWGWSDGRNESFVFTEVDRHISTGVQISGAHWSRRADRAGIAFAQTGIVQVHRDYLAAGGLGFLLGDGALRYGPEQLMEAYYRLQLDRYLQIGPDVQYIRDPGYNRDRGPATVASLRVNLRY